MNARILATRQSPLALTQAGLVADHLHRTLGWHCTLLKIVTTGDRQLDWNLEQTGGKGLFTSELEHSLLTGQADAAVHSTKDLPGEMSAGLGIAGYLPRADARDVLVMREGVSQPQSIATGSPRRRLQLRSLFPGATFLQLRGNVDTRLRKIAAGEADATVLAAAGLDRLGIGSWPRLQFRRLEPAEMVPAVGQGAVAIQCRVANVAALAEGLDPVTAVYIKLERAIQAALGGGCHTALGAYAAGDRLHIYHEQTGPRQFAISAEDLAAPARTAQRILGELKLLQASAA